MTRKSPLPREQTSGGQPAQILGGAGGGSLLAATLSALPASLQDLALWLSPWVTMGFYWVTGRLYVALIEFLTKRRHKADIAYTQQLLKDIKNPATVDRLTGLIEAARAAEIERILEPQDSETALARAARSGSASSDGSPRLNDHDRLREPDPPSDQLD